MWDKYTTLRLQTELEERAGVQLRRSSRFQFLPYISSAAGFISVKQNCYNSPVLDSFQRDSSFSLF